MKIDIESTIKKTNTDSNPYRQKLRKILRFLNQFPVQRIYVDSFVVRVILENDKNGYGTQIYIFKDKVNLMVYKERGESTYSFWGCTKNIIENLLKYLCGVLPCSFNFFMENKTVTVTFYLSHYADCIISKE